MLSEMQSWTWIRCSCCWHTDCTDCVFKFIFAYLWCIRLLSVSYLRRGSCWLQCDYCGFNSTATHTAAAAQASRLEQWCWWYSENVCGAGGLAQDWATSDAGASSQPAASLPPSLFNGFQDQCDMLGHGDPQSPCWCACVGGLVVLVLLCALYSCREPLRERERVLTGCCCCCLKTCLTKSGFKITCQVLEHFFVNKYLFVC